MVDNEQVRESFWKKQGFVVEIKPKHWTLKSRYLIETQLGKPLNPACEVHYKDGNYLNCVLTNLIVKDFPNKQEWWFDPFGNIITRTTPIWCRKYSHCRHCNTNEIPHKGIGLCTKCYYIDYWK